MEANNRHSGIKQTLYFLTALLISAILIRVFIIDSFTVVGNSMAPTILPGDHVFVSKLAYFRNTPAKNDVVVANFRGLNDIKAIKRVIALPGDWVSVRDNQLIVSKERTAEGEVSGEVDKSRTDLADVGEGLYYRLDPYEYFLSGDNEVASKDSFELGPVDSYHIDGKVFLIFRLSKLQFIKI